MKKVASEADGMLGVLRDVDSELASLMTAQPQNWARMSYDAKVKFLDEMKGGLENTQNVTDTLQKSNEQQQEMLGNLQNMGVQQSTTTPMAQASRRFNLKRFAQELPSLPTTPTVGTPPAGDAMGQGMEQDAGATGDTSAAQVRQLLDGFVQEAVAGGMEEGQAKAKAIDTAYQQITSQFTNPNESTTDPFSKAQGNSEQTVRDAVNSYYSSDDEAEKDRAASLLARTIFPQDQTQDGSVESGEVPALQQEGVKVNVANLVKQTNEIIKRLADRHASSSKKPVFNLSKTAKAFNYIITNDDETVEDSVTGTHELMTNLHFVERNKGYGIKLKDWHNLDWERVWRENVMDKYDPLYIERRFEVDKNIPPSNDMRLAPGEKRRITPPEYGNTEARLEAERTKMNKDRGYAPSEPGKPFNWKKAELAAKKSAQTVAPPPEIGGNPLKPAKMQKQEWLCHGCHNPLEVSDANSPSDRCIQCGALQNGNAIPGKYKNAPDPAKTTTSPSGGGGPVMGSTNVEKLATAHSGIFFDSADMKFVVVASDKKKKKFDTYYEAEEFKMLAKEPDATASPAAPVTPTKKKPTLTPQQVARQRQIAQHADGLGIDG